MPPSDGPAQDSTKDILSAGVVVLGQGKRVLLVHRPRYDDWSFPKGKLDPGERAPAAAVREVEEETGLRVRLGPPLSSQRYQVREGMKTVRYWTGRVVGDEDTSSYEPNSEVDEVAWLDIDKARRRLTYEHDLGTLDVALAQPRKTRTFVILRHAVARSRSSWSADDRLRPLQASGLRQSERLVPVLRAYDIRQLVTSSSTRCVQTLEPYADATGWTMDREDALTEEDATPRTVRRLVRRLASELQQAPSSAGGLVLCAHRPVLPWAFDAFGLDDPHLAKGEMMVLHLKRGKVRATERHQSG